MNVRIREAFGSAFQTDFLVEDDCHFTRAIGTYYARWNFRKTNIKERLVFSQGTCALRLKGMQLDFTIPLNTFSVYCRGNSVDHNSMPIVTSTSTPALVNSTREHPMSHCTPQIQNKAPKPRNQKQYFVRVATKMPKFKHSVLQQPVIHGMSRRTYL